MELLCGFGSESDLNYDGYANQVPATAAWEHKRKSILKSVSIRFLPSVGRCDVRESSRNDVGSYAELFELNGYLALSTMRMQFTVDSSDSFFENVCSSLRFKTPATFCPNHEISKLLISFECCTKEQKPETVFRIR
jgi:hypothetical protein